MLSSYNNYIFIKNEIQSSNINTKSGIIIIHILIVVNQSERGDFTKKRVISVLKILIVQKKIVKSNESISRNIMDIFPYKSKFYFQKMEKYSKKCLEIDSFHDFTRFFWKIGQIFFMNIFGT